MKRFVFKWVWVWLGLAIALLGAGFWGVEKHGGFTYALALAGDPTKQYEYGLWLDKEGQKPDALMWMGKAADGYETRAMVWLGLTYQGGGYFAAPDVEQSFHFFKEAAERNNALGMFMLATMFESSAFVRQQASKQEADAGAMVWYMRAAENGVGPAIDRLVKVYENGELGEVKDKKKADIWRNKPRKTDDYWREYMGNGR
jgi:TPR repeat protein